MKIILVLMILLLSGCGGVAKGLGVALRGAGAGLTAASQKPLPKTYNCQSFDQGTTYQCH